MNWISTQGNFDIEKRTIKYLPDPEGALELRYVLGLSKPYEGHIKSSEYFENGSIMVLPIVKTKNIKFKIEKKYKIHP